MNASHLLTFFLTIVSFAFLLVSAKMPEEPSQFTCYVPNDKGVCATHMSHGVYTDAVKATLMTPLPPSPNLPAGAAYTCDGFWKKLDLCCPKVPQHGKAPNCSLA